MTTRTLTIELPKEETPAVPAVLYSVEQAAQALGVARSTVYVLIGEGALRTVMIGKRRMVPVAEIHRFASCFTERQL